MALAPRGDITWVWDLTRDRPKIGGGKAANRLEVDRLLKRNEKLNADREALRKQLADLDKEAGQISDRIDELQSE
jgi:predicted  nucleic acid-binding Zn-ribbon protein